MTTYSNAEIDTKLNELASDKENQFKKIGKL